MKGKPFSNLVVELKDQSRVLSLIKPFDPKLDNLPHAFKLMIDKSLNYEISIDEFVVLKGSSKDFLELQETEAPKKKEVKGDEKSEDEKAEDISKKIDELKESLKHIEAWIY